MRKALAKKAEDRYPTAQAFSAALNEVEKSFGQQEDDSFFAGTTLVAAGDLTSDGSTVVSSETRAPKSKVKIAILAAVYAVRIGTGAWFAMPAPALGTVAILTEPEQATVMLKGKALGETPIEVQLPSGEHVIVLRKSNFQDQEVSVIVEANAISDVYLPLSPK